MAGPAPNPEVNEALEELQQYLSDTLPPLIVADSIRLLLDYSPDLVAKSIQSWTASQYRGATEIPLSDYLFHAIKKIKMMGDFRLVPREPFELYLSELKERVLALCPAADRDFLRSNFEHMGEASGATAAAIDVIFRQTSATGAKTTTSASGGVSGEEALNVRRLSLLLDRLEREIGAGPGGAKAGPLASQTLAAAARGSQTAKELEQYLERLRDLGLNFGTSDVLRSLGNSLPGWIVPMTEQAGETGPRSRTVEAMHRIVTEPDDPAEGARRFHDMVKTAIERFNEGSLAQAVTMIELAERIIAEKKIDPSTADVVRKKADEAVDLERLRKYAEYPDQHEPLRRFLSFFSALSPDGLLTDLQRELKRERRRLLLLLLEVHGLPAREAALERLRAKLGDVVGDEDWYYRRNLLYLLRRIPRAPGSPEDEDVDIAVRHSSLNLPAPLVKESIANLGQLKHERSERTLVALLGELEGMLAKPTEAPYDPREMRLLLDRVVAALARFGTPSARRAVVDHGLKKKPELGDTTARLAELAGQDLSSDEELVDRLLAALKSHAPFKLFGLVLHQNDQNLFHCIEALSTTPLPAVRQAFEDISRRFPGQEAGRAAAKALASFGKASSAPSEGSAASLSGDLELFGLPALMQSLAESKVSGSLTLRDAKGEVYGTITLRSGRLKACNTGRLTGEEGFFQLLERPIPGKFQFSRQPEILTEDVSRLRDVLPLSLEGMRRYDEFQQSAVLVPDEMVLKATEAKPMPHPDEKDGILVNDLWTAISQGKTARECESELRADSYRIRRLLAHWVETGGLQPTG